MGGTMVNLPDPGFMLIVTIGGIALGLIVQRFLTRYVNSLFNESGLEDWNRTKITIDVKGTVINDMQIESGNEGDHVNTNN